MGEVWKDSNRMNHEGGEMIEIIKHEVNAVECAINNLGVDMAM